MGIWEWVQWRADCGAVRGSVLGKNSREVKDSWVWEGVTASRGSSLWPMEPCEAEEARGSSAALSLTLGCPPKAVGGSTCRKFTGTSGTKTVPSSVCADAAGELRPSCHWVWRFFFPALLEDFSKAVAFWLSFFVDYQSINYWTEQWTLEWNACSLLLTCCYLIGFCGRIQGKNS